MTRLIVLQFILGHKVNRSSVSGSTKIDQATICMQSLYYKITALIK